MAVLTKIGNSRGIRIPKSIIEQAELEGREIRFEVTPEGLLLKPVKGKARQGWEEQIRRTLEEKGNEDPGILSDWADEPMEEWEW